MKKIICTAEVALFILLAGCTQSNTATYIFEGQSMAPTIADGDKFVEDIGFYEKEEISRGDIVVYSRDGQKHAKRVVALPGESIRFEDGALIINGKPIEDESIPTDITVSTEEVNLLEDEYFIVGDGSENSKDSRHFGPVKKDDISGKVIEIVPQS